MTCEDKLIVALTQTHRALLACSSCVNPSSMETEDTLLADLCETLAALAKTLHAKLLNTDGLQRQ